MTYTDPTPATADDDSPAAALNHTRRQYTDTGKRIAQLTEEKNRALQENAAANTAHMKRMTEIRAELTAARKANKEWFDMLPPRDPYRKNGTQ